MHRLLPLLLTVFILLTQFGLTLHAHQDHNSHEVCHLCLSSSQHDHALISNPATLSITGSFNLQERLIKPLTTQRPVRYYAVRAPPYFL